MIILVVVNNNESTEYRLPYILVWTLVYSTAAVDATMTWSPNILHEKLLLSHLNIPVHLRHIHPEIKVTPIGNFHAAFKRVIGIPSIIPIRYRFYQLVGVDIDQRIRTSIAVH